MESQIKYRGIHKKKAKDEVKKKEI